MTTRRGFLASLAGSAAASVAASHTAAAQAPALAESPVGPATPWAEVAAQFDLDPAQLFFNPGTLGSCPRPVRQRVVDTLRQIDSAPTFEYWARCMPRYFDVLGKAARLLGAEDPASVTITHSTTEGMNIVARGLGLKPGDEVVTTTHEHPGGDAIFRHLERGAGVKVKRLAMPFAPPEDQAIVEGIRRLVTPRTRLLMVSHVLYTNALIMPVEALGRLAKELGILYLVDGAHPPGQMPVDVRAIGCDFYAASGHKWLCAPRGTGLLYVRPSVLDRLEPLLVSYDFAQPPRDVGRFHQAATRLNFVWTNNIHDVMGLEAAIDFHTALGASRVRARCMELLGRFAVAVRDVPNLEPVMLPAARSAPMLTLKVKGRSNSDVFRALKKLGITVKEVLDHELPEPINAIRVATHLFNTEEQVDRLAAGLRQVMTA
jgi:L-cysteine/cystine lyase